MRLSPLAYYADFFISLTLIAGLAGTASFGAALQDSLVWFASFLAGLIAWTFVEYLVHRILYHQVPYFERLHDAHHAEPNSYIGAPPIIGIVGIFAVFFVPALTFGYVIASGAVSGILAGYIGYMLIHHAAHFWKLPPTSWLYWARRHHALHHYHHDLGNFGIITSFWDHVFGTALQGRRRTPRLKLR